jgi:hypothetical protein
VASAGTDTIGRISTEPERADGIRAAQSRASWIVSQSMMS